jgi:hypothetical protein
LEGSKIIPSKKYKYALLLPMTSGAIADIASTSVVVGLLFTAPQQRLVDRHRACSIVD